MKALLTVCVPGMVEVIRARLPADIQIVKQADNFEKAIVILRLEGEGLPDWAEMPKFLGRYARGYVRIDGDGVVRFCPEAEDAGPAPILEWLRAQFGASN